MFDKEKEILETIEKNKDLLQVSLSKQLEIIKELERIEKKLSYIRKKIRRDIVFCLEIFTAGVVVGILIAKILF